MVDVKIVLRDGETPSLRTPCASICTSRLVSTAAIAVVRGNADIVELMKAAVPSLQQNNNNGQA